MTDINSIKTNILNINDVVEKELGYNVRSGKYKIICPFHNDSDPSMMIYPDTDNGRGSYFCFGCRASGDSVSMLIKLRNDMTVYEVFQYIETEYGVVIDNENINRKEIDSGLIDMINILVYSNFFKTRNRIKAFEIAITMYMKGEKKVMNKLVSKSVKD